MEYADLLQFVHRSDQNYFPFSNITSPLALLITITTFPVIFILEIACCVFSFLSPSVRLSFDPANTPALV